MSTIQVQSPGLFTTVQDLGRPGFGPMGLSPSGAADPLSLRLGNRLVGNPDGAAALEMTLVGGEFLFPEGSVVALAGSDFGASINDQPIPVWTATKISSGQILRAGQTRSGARCYLCIQGGIEVDPFQGSASTHILSGLGGLDGRALRKGDVLNIGPASTTFRERKISPQLLPRLSARRTLRVTLGPQSDWFVESSQGLFYANSYRVTEDSNRMGLRLEGVSIPPHNKGQMITEGVSLGAIQITDGGQPIILLVEQQTTGGYPKIANVISADLPSIGQLRPRDEIRFEQVDWDAARTLFKEQEDYGIEGVGAGVNRIDLNCDMGEIPEAVADGTQEALMSSLTSVNIACGGHAGDEATMQATIEQALRHQLAIGAHPGYPDRANFGRLELNLPMDAVANSVFEQVRALAAITQACRAQIVHVKPHGALYNQAVNNTELASAIARGVARWSREVSLVGLAGSRMLDVFRDAGFRVASEAFADRRYEPDGTLRSRKFIDALLKNPGDAAQQALNIVEQGKVIASDGSEVVVNAQTLCIHGDTPGATQIASAIAQKLREAGVLLRPLAG